jgi:Phage tail assembly chaperone protein
VDETTFFLMLRSHRNYLLSQCDWRVLPDLPSTLSTGWSAYRQSLRDLPASTTWVEGMDPVTGPAWPVPPAG